MSVRDKESKKNKNNFYDEKTQERKKERKKERKTYK